MISEEYWEDKISFQMCVGIGSIREVLITYCACDFLHVERKQNVTVPEKYGIQPAKKCISILASCKLEMLSSLKWLPLFPCGVSTTSPVYRYSVDIFS